MVRRRAVASHPIFAMLTINAFFDPTSQQDGRGRQLFVRNAFNLFAKILW
jgi:hypothetical protein